MSDHQAHWFDRFSARRTRRGAIKAALAGGAALTLPLTRAAPALADDPHACQKGCAFTASKAYSSAQNTCAGLAYTQHLLTLGGFSLGGAVFAAPYFQAISLCNGMQTQDRCLDKALLQLKASYYDCIQPGCPGFDPTASGGPCDTCYPPAICCPDQNVVGGYSCCTAPPGGCCMADGCHSGVTDCGGG